jgi:serine/threonine protein phosphatase 1
VPRLSWKPFSPKPSPPTIPDGALLFAFGDVHGRADLLREMMEAVAANASTADHLIVVGLGDYVDRGPDSSDVIDQLISWENIPGLETHFLTGNHEQMMLRFLADARGGPSWCGLGGRDTLHSYGVSAPMTAGDTEGWETARLALTEVLPPEHLDFLNRLESRFELGDYFFAHAGARPGVTLENQVEKDLYWIREPFLSHRKAFNKVIVHGHSQDVEVYADSRRIGIDTGAYATGVLTALRLEGATTALIQTGRPGASVTALQFAD